MRAVARIYLKTENIKPNQRTLMFCPNLSNGILHIYPRYFGENGTKVESLIDKIIYLAAIHLGEMELDGFYDTLFEFGDKIRSIFPEVEDIEWHELPKEKGFPYGGILPNHHIMWTSSSNITFDDFLTKPYVIDFSKETESDVDWRNYDEINPQTGYEWIDKFLHPEYPRWSFHLFQ